MTARVEGDAGRRERVEALLRYRVLDTRGEPEFDDLAALAAEIAGFPMAAITFVDDRREWVKAASGCELGEAPAEHSLGAHAIASPREPMVVSDAAGDPRFEHCAWVAGEPRVRAYGALPLTTPGGLAIGTLCVLDREPRSIDRHVLERLQRVARLVMTQLERRREAAVAEGLVAVVGFDGHFKRVNVASATVLGYEPEEMIGRRGLDFIHPDDIAPSRERLERAVAGESGSFENRYRTKDGRYRWLLWNGHAVWEEEVFYGVAKDITERKEAELALRASEQRYRLLAESATDMISSHTLDGTFLYVSSACKSLLGYEPAELVGTDGSLLFHPDDSAALRAKYERLLERGGRDRETCRFRRKDGSWVWVEVVGRIADDEHGRPILQAATRDMTDARRALEALQHAEEGFRRAFDDAPIGMAIFDVERRAVRVNKALCELLGRTPEEILGRLGRDFADPRDREVMSDRVDRLADGDFRSVSMENRYVHKDGHLVWAQSTVSLMRGADGKPTGLLAQIQDISDRRRAEAETRRARIAAERANQAKSDFLSRMSHELRTPLNAVLGFAQLLGLDDLSPEQLDSVERIISGGNHLLGLINDVLDISRIEAGQFPISLAPVPLQRAVEDVVELLAPVAAARSVELRTDLSRCDSVEVRADRQRFEQVLLNLVSNAIKYGPEGSVVEVRAERGRGVARVAVADEGPGVRPEDLEKLFVPFERLGAVADGVEGTGLGLALSRNLAEAMGGTVGVESAETSRSGSVFWVELPLATESDRRDGDRKDDGARRFASRQRGIALHRPSASTAVAARKVLHIEDNPADVRLVHGLVASHNRCDVLHAGTGAAGIELARREHPDAILLDLELPDMSGREVLASLRDDAATSDIPVIVVSALAGPNEAERALAQGASAYEAKPIDVQRLFRALDRALPAPSYDG